MKIVIAPDSYKNCLSANKVAKIISDGIHTIYPEAETILLPLADGGEGTTQAIIQATGGKIYTCEVHDSLMRKIQGFYGIIETQATAVVEIAAASGIELLKNSELDILNASSYGSGEIINFILENHSIKKLFIGLGGSATNDGGTGLLQALGAEFFDYNGNKIPQGISGKDLINIAQVKTDKLNKKLQNIEIIVGCDVKNPLTGENGASAIFGPQKGATPENVKFLDKGLANFRKSTPELPGDGAAGGIAFALRNYLDAKIISGAEALLTTCDFEKKIQNATIVITGEGKSDLQTVEGKLCYIVSKIAAQHGLPTALISGAIKDTQILQKYFSHLIQVTPEDMAIDEAIKSAPELLKNAAITLAIKLNK